MPMTRVRSILFVTVAFVGLAALALPGARSADAQPVAPTEGKPAAAAGAIPAEHMKDVSFEGLDDAKKAMAVQLFNEQGCDCGCGMKVAGCRKDDSKCGRSKELANQALALYKEGKTKEEIIKAAFQPPSKYVQSALT